MTRDRTPVPDARRRPVYPVEMPDAIEAEIDTQSRRPFRCTLAKHLIDDGALRLR